MIEVRRIAALCCAIFLGLAGPPAFAQEEPSWAPHERPDRKPSNAELEKSVIDELGLSTHELTQKYVAGLCERLAPHAALGAQRVRCIVIDQALPNAFALPSGAIYVSRGLLALSGSEAELAGVLGHEIGHVSLQHAAAREAVIESLGPLAIGFSAAQYLAAFSREQESTADREGQQIAAAAGFSPDGLPKFLRRLEVTDRLRFGASRIPGFFDTHPGNVARMADTADRAHNLRFTPRSGIAPDEAAFLAKLEGLMIGPNPSEGVFVGSRFLHPDLGFTVYFPDGWTLVNTPAAVGGLAPRRAARL
jgi:predicted Zn-dependent protease